MCRCRPWPPGPGTCGSPGRKPLAPSSCRSPHPSKCVIGDPSPGASPTAQAGSEAPGRPPACLSVGPHQALVPFDCGLSRTGHVFVPLPGARLAHGSQSELSEVRQRDRGTKGEVCTPPSRAPVQPPAGGGWEGPAEHRAAPSRPGRPWPLACGGRSCWVWRGAPAQCPPCSGSGRPSCPPGLSFPTCRVGALDCTALRPVQLCLLSAAGRCLAHHPALCWCPSGRGGGGEGSGQGDEPHRLSWGCRSSEACGRRSPASKPRLVFSVELS